MNLLKFMKVGKLRIRLHHIHYLKRRKKSRMSNTKFKNKNHNKLNLTEQLIVLQ